LGDIPYGCTDMAGNVLEWTASWYDKEQKWRVVRGGSWVSEARFCRCALRFRRDPYDWSDYLGFRPGRPVLNISDL
jgi:formylglycine-generating enzyme required for sulfatase activity